MPVPLTEFNGIRCAVAMNDWNHVAIRCSIVSNRYNPDKHPNPEATMRMILTLAVGVMLGIGGWTMAHHDGPARGPARVISEKDIGERIDGEQSKVTTVEVTLEPGQSNPPHRHPGPVFGYILEGEYELAINDQPVQKLKTADTFYEPTRCLHRVSRNPSEKGKTRVLAVLLSSRDVKQISIPEKKD
jgi:quercetin dioxygenase-like cupin family protein